MSEVRIITRERDGVVQIEVYKDHKTLHVIDLSDYQMYSLHQKLTEALYKKVGMKDRLLWQTLTS